MELCSAASDFEIKNILQDLPEGMASTYARIVRKISKTPVNMRWAPRVLKWICCAKRSLHLDELREAVAFGPDDRSWDVSKSPDPSRLIQACGHLIELNEDDDTVRLAHHTVQQFLLKPPTQDSIPAFHFQLSQANIEAGEICIRYLSFSDFETQITTKASSLMPPQQVPAPFGVLGSVHPR